MSFNASGGARFRFKGPPEVCSRYRSVARFLVERTRAMYDIDGAGADAATNTTRLQDGAVIKVTVFAQSPPIITIDVRQQKGGEDQDEEVEAYGLNTQVAFYAEPEKTYGQYTALIGFEHPKGLPLMTPTPWKKVGWFTGAAYPDIGNWERWRLLRGGYKLSQSLARKSQACMVQVPTLPVGTVDPWADTSTHIVLGGLYNGTVKGKDSGIDPLGPPNPLGTYSGNGAQMPLPAEQPEESTSSFWIMNHDNVLYAVEHPFPLTTGAYPDLHGTTFTLNVWRVSKLFSFPRTEEARQAAVEKGDFIGEVEIVVNDPAQDSYATIIEIDDVHWDGKKLLLKSVDEDSTDMYVGRTGKWISGGVEVVLDVSVSEVTGDMTIVPSAEVIFAGYNYWWKSENPHNLKEVYTVHELLEPDVPQYMWDLIPQEIVDATIIDPAWYSAPSKYKRLGRTVSDNIHIWREPYEVSHSWSNTVYTRWRTRYDERPTNYDPDDYADLPTPPEPPPHDYIEGTFCGNTYERVAPGTYESIVNITDYSVDGDTLPDGVDSDTQTINRDAFFRGTNLLVEGKSNSSYAVFLIVGAYYGDDGQVELVRMAVDNSTSGEYYLTPSATGILRHKRVFVTDTVTSSCNNEPATRTITTLDQEEFEYDLQISYSVTSTDRASSSGAVYCKRGLLFYTENTDPVTFSASDSFSVSGTTNSLPSRQTTSFDHSTTTNHVLDLSDFFPAPYDNITATEEVGKYYDGSVGFRESSVTDSLTSGGTVFVDTPSFPSTSLISVNHWGWIGDHIQAWWPQTDESIFPHGADSAVEARMHVCAGSGLFMVESHIGNWETEESISFNSPVITPYGKLGEAHEADGASRPDPYLSADDRGTGLPAAGARELWRQPNNCSVNRLTRQVALYFPCVVNFAGVWPKTWRYGPYKEYDVPPVDPPADPLNMQEVMGSDGKPVYVIDYRNIDWDALGVTYEDQS